MEYLVKFKKYIKHTTFIFLFLSSLWLVKNNLNYNITESHPDEIHTMNFGVKSMYSGEVTTLRVGESTRWLARGIYPLALYYMNGKMGGEHFVTGWNYPSGFYINKHFDKPASIKGDPNLQDFTFAMKFILATLVLLSFILVSYKISSRFGFLAGVSYFIFSFSSSLIMEMLSIFYTESSLVIIFNLIVALALTKQVNIWRLYIYFAMLLAFAISTKLTGIILAVPVITVMLKKDNLFKKIKLEGFILLTLIFLAVVNIYASSYMALLDQTLANVYHFKTGHKITQPSGMFQLKRIINVLSPWLYLFPIALLLIILLKKRVKSFPFLIAVSISSIIIFLPLIGAHIFLARNLTTPMVMMVFIISIALGLLIKSINYKPQLLLIISIFCLLSMHVFSIQKQYRPIERSLLNSYVSNGQKIGTIGVKNGLIDNATVIPSMPDSFTLRDTLNHLREQFLPYDYLVVKRENNNKHYTNYILPLDYELRARHGNYFIYANETRAFIHNKLSNLEGHLISESSKFDIYLKNDTLTYHKRFGSADDIKDKFFVHVYPKNVTDLPDERLKYGIDDKGFKAPPSSIFGSDIFIEVPLPKYPIQFVFTGQYSGKNNLWEEKININK